MRFQAVLLVAASLAASTFADLRREVTLRELLSEMADLKRLARRPNAEYTQAQASSYDRNAKTPGNEAWFANGDAGKFLGEDKKPDRIERIMAELKGPGVVNRIWSANPVGILRFYFDGESEARFAWNMPDLLSGKIRPFADPFAYVASKGWNIYFPIPYRESLKITIDDTKGDGVRGLYYHVGYRTYGPGATVRSLTAEALEGHRSDIERTAARISTPPPDPTPNHRRLVEPLRFDTTILEKAGPGAITMLSLKFERNEPVAALADLGWEHPLQLHHALRNTRIVAEFDGERCIDTPVPDFFASSAGPVPFETMPISVRADGTMICRFVMPFGKSAKVRLVPLGGPALNVQVEAKVEPFRFDGDSYHFRAQWLHDHLSSRPFKDMEFLTAAGEGHYVGSSLHIGNPTGAWWGEGDEKVFVDGEPFPSTFGTGTEDYFGYAWSNPELFVRPYHAQPRCDGPGTRGHIQNIRWHISDPIPFRSKLAFFIELWHWAEVSVDFDRVAFWYTRPGGTTPAAVEDRKSLLLTHYPRPAPVKGAVEGESARILSKSGGITETQEFGELSDGRQLWWRDLADGDRLVLAIPVKEDGLYEVTGNFCMARDYGRHQFSLGGTPLGEPIDFFSPNLQWKTMNLGRVQLKAGQAEFVAECKGHHASADPRRMLGVDYILLKRVG